MRRYSPADFVVSVAVVSLEPIQKDTGSPLVQFIAFSQRRLNPLMKRPGLLQIAYASLYADKKVLPLALARGAWS